MQSLLSTDSVSSDAIHTSICSCLHGLLFSQSLPSDKVDFKGNRLVLCPRCLDYVKHGKDSITNSSLQSHQSSQKCKATFCRCVVIAGLNSIRHSYNTVILSN